MTSRSASERKWVLPLAIAANSRQRYLRFIPGVFAVRMRFRCMDCFFGGCSPTLYEWVMQHNAALLPHGVLCWNDEREIIDPRLDTAVRRYTFFRSVERSVNLSRSSAAFTVHRIRMALPRRCRRAWRSSGIVFAGQALEPRDHSEAVRTAAFDIAEDFTKYAGLFEADPSGEKECSSLINNIENRLNIVAHFRILVLRTLAQRFGGRCRFYLSGQGAKNVPGALAPISGSQARREYQAAGCNVDLGSQCGSEWVYPRAVELMSCSDRVCQVSLPADSGFTSRDAGIHAARSLRNMLDIVDDMLCRVYRVSDREESVRSAYSAAARRHNDSLFVGGAS